MSVLIDALILGLLVATIGYAFLVERRVRGLMKALADVYPAISAFSDAVDRSEGSVKELRSLADPLQEFGKRDFHLPLARGQHDRIPARIKRAQEVLKVPGKSELIRSFFENARENRA